MVKVRPSVCLDPGGRVLAQEHLGLFDTPPDRREIRIGLAIVGLVVVALLIALPVRDVHVGAIAGLIPTVNAVMVVCDLITGAILYAQAAVFRSRALTALASGYVLAGLLLIPWALTFPGVFAEDGLLGAKVNTTAWIGISWRLTVPVAVTLYALLKRADVAAGPIANRPPARVFQGLLIAIALTLLVSLLTTLGHDLLPAFYINRGDVIRSTLVIANAVVILWTVAAMVLLFRQQRSVLDMWLLVAMSAWLAQSVLNEFLHSRFSYGMYALLGLVLVSDLIVMLALITESTRLYARLALSTAARDRERDARLMSMDAVAAAIAHEVAQPIAATRLSGSAALAWLTRSEPDPGKAIKSLHEMLASGERTLDVIQSIRTTFAKGAGNPSEFHLNDLVRETAALMDRELGARKVSLELVLDDALPPILADRVQIQRVLINLLTNAIESLAATPGRGRRIAIRSILLDEQHVLLDVSDSGVGIPPEKMAEIFEPFVTTKASGTGLGLSLSRSIVEEHGGRLWASAGEHQGATFHMQLKRHPEAA